jgi:hypothetical protein
LPTSLAAISDELDEQRRLILPEIRRLQEDLADARESLQMLAEFLNSPEGRAELFLPEILQSPLVRNLATIAAASTDPDGWCRLKPALIQLDDFPSENITAHLTQLGQKSLTSLLQASRLFETRAEPTKGGKHHMLYRLKPTPPAKHGTSHPAATG